MYIAPEDAQKILGKLLARVPMRIESFSLKGPVKKYDLGPQIRQTIYPYTGMT